MIRGSLETIPAVQFDHPVVHGIQTAHQVLAVGRSRIPDLDSHWRRHVRGAREMRVVSPLNCRWSEENPPLWLHESTRPKGLVPMGQSLPRLPSGN